MLNSMQSLEHIFQEMPQSSQPTFKGVYILPKFNALFLKFLFIGIPPLMPGVPPLMPGMPPVMPGMPPG